MTDVRLGFATRARTGGEGSVRFVEETYPPGMSVSLFAAGMVSAAVRSHLVPVDEPMCVVTAAAGEEVVPASEYRHWAAEVRKLQRLLGQEGHGE